LQDAGITVSPDPISVVGHVLPTPRIHYGNPANSRPVVSPARRNAWGAIIWFLTHSNREMVHGIWSTRHSMSRRV
jgi:hypothetical protein